MWISGSVHRILCTRQAKRQGALECPVHRILCTWHRRAQGPVCVHRILCTQHGRIERRIRAATQLYTESCVHGRLGAKVPHVPCTQDSVYTAGQAPREINQCIDQSIDRSMIEWINRSIDRSLTNSINPSLSQSAAIQGHKLQCVPSISSLAIRSWQLGIHSWQLAIKGCNPVYTAWQTSTHS